MGTEKFIYKDLSYKIVGLAFKVYNQIGFGHKEVVYQRALAEEFRLAGLQFERESRFPMYYANELIGMYIPDFVIDKIIIELKVKSRIGYIHIHQVISYLKISGCRLAIIIYFTKEGVKYRRVLHPQ